MEPIAVAISDGRWQVRMRLLALAVLCASVTPLLPAGRQDLRAVPAFGPRVAPSPISGPSLTFVRNVGQSDPRIRFAATTAFGDAMFTDRGAVLRLAGPAGKPGWVLQTAFVSGRPATPEGVHRSSTVVSYFGAGRRGWSGRPPAFDEVRYPRVWPGVDVTYSGRAGRIESTFVVHPGADPGDIRLRFLGQTTMAVNATMGVVLGTPLGSVVEPPPVAYQLVDGARVPVPARFRMVVGDGGSAVGLSLGPYDRSRALVIDPPMIIQAGYVGGSADDVAYRVAVDAAGNQYVTGATTSTDADFPVTVGPDLTYNGGPRDIFVAKVSADGSQLVYAGYIGGDGKQEAGLDIAVDAAGNAYVVGATSSTEATFPVVGGPDLTYNGGSQDGFIAEVSADGTRLLFCGYIGGAKVDEALRVSIDATGDAFVTGYTASNERTFPVQGGPDLTQNGGIDAYVAEVAPNGAGLVFAGFLGGVGKDIAFGLGRDAAGNIYVAGMTASTEATFPATVGPDVTYDGGATDAFVAKVSPDGGSILYAGYIGGSGNEKAKNLAVDAAGDAYVVGYTDSTDATFPVAVGPDLTYNGGTKDVFVAEVDPTGSSLRYAGYIGGASSDEARSVAIDGAGSAFVTGYTSSPPSSFPVIGGPSLTYRGHTDAFVCVVGPGGTGLSSCGYVGGTGQDQGLGIALGSSGDVYVVGQTGSTEASFPLAVGPDLTYNGGTHDAFVSRISYASR